MSYREDIAKLTELLAEVNIITERINNELAESAVQENKNPDVLAHYKSAFQEDSDSNVYYLDMNSEIRCISNNSAVFPFSNDDIHASNYYNPYHMYLSEGYAKRAAKMKKFNDILLAFKWCCDRDYEPDWSNGDSEKYSIYYDTDDAMYTVGLAYDKIHSAVHFGIHIAAQKCANWLNRIDPKGELVK